MNHWQESAEIVSRLGELATAGKRAALATVVRIVGSAYRRPGAKLLIEEAGGTLGSVSGGCLEADVREVAKAVLESGQPWLRHYNTADENVVWGLGLGCNGQVDVFVQPATGGPLAELTGRLRELFAGDAAFALATVVAGRDGESLGASLLVEPEGGLRGSLVAADADSLIAERARGLVAAGRSGVIQVAGRTVFVEVLPPPPHLVVCGAGDDARPLVAYAADAGFRVTLFDHRPGLLDPAWFPRAARLVVARPEDPEIRLPPAACSVAVVKMHSLADDREWVRRLLAAGLPYVGVLGPRARTESILRHISEAEPDGAAAGAPGADGAPGAPAAPASERVFAPVGLDLGADGPRQVAMSIVAELLAFTSKREPRHLSERREAIHVG